MLHNGEPCGITAFVGQKLFEFISSFICCNLIYCFVFQCDFNDFAEWKKLKSERHTWVFSRREK